MDAERRAILFSCSAANHAALRQKVHFLSQGEGGADSILYFRVPDIHAAHAALTGRGAVFLNAPHMIHKHEDGTEEWMAFFNDNEGRPLAIMSQAGP